MIRRVIPGLQQGSFSFSIEVRNQVAAALEQKDCCAQAALLALLVTCGGETRQSGEENFLVFSVSNLAVARALFRLSCRIFSDRPQFERQYSKKLGRNRLVRMVLRLDPDDFQRLASLDELKRRFKRRACCRRAFLRGAFLGCGSMVDPERAYHLEFSAPEGLVGWIQELLAQEEIQAGCYRRGGQANLTLYIKSSDDIARFLSLAGAHQAMLRLEAVILSRDLRNNVQRAVNCETANLERTVSTATRQLEDIGLIEEAGLLEELPAELHETIRLRLAHPYASLQELADLHAPPCSKSGINHRLRRIREIASLLQAPRASGPETRPLSS